MKDTGSSPRVEVLDRPPGALEQVESIVLTLVGAMMSLLLTVCGGVLAFRTEGTRTFFWAFPVWLVTLVGVMLFLVSLRTALLLGPQPFIPEFALRQPRWPLLLRPLIAAFWLAHLAPSLMFALIMEDGLAGERFDWRALAIVVPVVAFFSHGVRA